jgi:hypothetical protein
MAERVDVARVWTGLVIRLRRKAGDSQGENACQHN